jgi:hypothetical protein
MYFLAEFSTVPFTIVLISRISTMVNGTMLNAGNFGNSSRPISMTLCALTCTALLVNVVFINLWGFQLCICNEVNYSVGSLDDIFEEQNLLLKFSDLSNHCQNYFTTSKIV